MSYEGYERLSLSWPEERILVVTMDRPERLNAADETMHAELARIWRDIDADDDVAVAVLRGAGRGFSAGGDLDMVERIADDWDTRVRVWKEARDLVRNIIDCWQADRLGHPRAGGGCGSGGRAPRRRLGGGA